MVVRERPSLNLVQAEEVSNMPVPLIAHRPASDRKHYTRERTFTLVQLRPDFKDVVAQFVITLEQLHSERATGSWTINFSQGSVTNTKMTETQSAD